MKRVLALAIALLLVMTFAAPALAHGGHHTKTRAVTYTVCNYENCALVGTHRHENNWHTAHYYGDGHDYHEYCDVYNCTQVGYHEHDGVFCFAHTNTDGHGYHRINRGLRLHH